MRWRIADIRCKEVINICDGMRLGFVDDVILEVDNGRVFAFVVPGPCKFLGIFGREDDYIILWDQVVRIGDDIILIDIGDYKREKRIRKWWL